MWRGSYLGLYDADGDGAISKQEFSEEAAARERHDL